MTDSKEDGKMGCQSLLSKATSSPPRLEKNKTERSTAHRFGLAEACCGGAEKSHGRLQQKPDDTPAGPAATKNLAIEEPWSTSLFYYLQNNGV